MSHPALWLSPAVIGSALDVSFTNSRVAALLSVGVGVFALISAGFLYVRQLNRSHARLLAKLESELAERGKAEENLRKSEGFYHSLVEGLPQSILRKDLEGRFTFANQRFCASLERTLEQVAGTTDFDYFPRALAEKYRNDDKQVIKTREPFETVEEHITPHGETLYVHVIKTALRDSLGQIIGVQGLFWDVTERKRDEERLESQFVKLQEMARSEHEAHAALKQTQSRLVQAEKLASLGQMVAGVAHEINNPVSFVTNNVAVLGRDVGEMHDMLQLYREADTLIAREAPELAGRVQEMCERVDMDYTLQNILGLLERSRDGLNRIQQIVAHLRAFAHLDEGEINEADLNAGIESTVTIIVGHARKKLVQLEMDLQPLPLVTCYAAKINQVVMNLLTNAIDACSERGVVTIRSRVEPNGVRIEVRDNGRGIDPSVRDRIFDPFVTTKPVGQGTGLGLSISYGIIQDHGGSIEVHSTPGQGTCFTLHIPLRRPSPRDKKRPAEPLPENAGSPLAAPRV